MIIGFLGAGQMAQTLAPVWLRAGHRVLLANSRGPASLADLVATLGPAASSKAPAGGPPAVCCPDTTTRSPVPRRRRSSPAMADQSTSQPESVVTVLVALAVNVGIAVMKTLAGLFTGSAALLSEAAHSV